MPWRDSLTLSQMSRVALVAPDSCWRRVLVEVAEAGVFEPTPGPDPGVDGPATEALGRVGSAAEDASAELSEQPVDLDRLVDDERWSLLRGEAELERCGGAVARTERCSALTGWIASDDVPGLRARLDRLGGAVVELPMPRTELPPSAHRGTRMEAQLRPLVTTYGTVPYRDLDPTAFAAVVYMFMFGMMFGDVGHGLALVIAGALAARGVTGGLAPLRRVWPFLVGAGLASVGFGFLYGEAFGPTGLVPTVWVRPLDEPETVLLAGLVVGSVLLAVAFAFASVNRWREAGAAASLYAAAGLGGAVLFAGVAAIVGGLVGGVDGLWVAGTVIAVVGFVLVLVGRLAATGFSLAGLPEAIVEMFDTLLRLGSNVVSFTRLAAFGLTHAVITGVVWDGTTALWDGTGPVQRAGAVALFVVGNVAAFALGALVGAIQALRLEYYELFSRVFVAEGRPFAPFHLPLRRSEIP